jgi:hypothetical protein
MSESTFIDTHSLTHKFKKANLRVINLSGKDFDDMQSVTGHL